MTDELSMDAGIKHWTEHFGISEEQFTQWITTSGEANPLRWCLLNHKLSEPAYLSWASEAYEIPVVTDDFFQIYPDDSFWRAVSSAHFWNPGLFPLAEWEGILMIACVEPPENFRLNRPHRFVLASAQHLVHHWSKLNPNQATTLTSAPVKPQKTAPPAKAAPPPAKEHDPVEDSFIRAFSSFTGSEAPAIDAPAGLNLAPESFSGEDLTDGPDGLTRSITPKNYEARNTPDGLTLDVKSAMAARLDLPDGVSPTSFESSSDADETVEAVRIENEDHVVEQAANLVYEEPSKEAIEEEAFAEPQSDDSNFQDLEATATGISVEPAVTPPPRQRVPETTAIGLIDLDTITPKPINNCENLDELAVQSLSELAKTFESALILQYVNGIPTPWRWSGIKAKGKGPLGYSLDIVPPSMFRIVHSTQLPYSGRVPASPVHEQFFSIFSVDGAPAHATIVPVMSGKNVVAMLMGISTKTLPALEALDRVETLAGGFTKIWGRLHGTKAA